MTHPIPRSGPALPLRRSGRWRRTAWAFCIAVLLPFGTGRSETRAPHDGGNGSVTNTLRIAGDMAGLHSRPADLDATTGPGPLVVLLSDGPGADGRTEVYALRLLGLGVAAFEADFGSAFIGESGPGVQQAIPAGLRLGAVLAALADDPEIDPARIAVIGIGEGARAVLLARTGETPLAAAVLLYPGCDAPMRAAAGAPGSAIAGRPVLLMHGDADPANEPAACAGLAAVLTEQGAQVTHRVLRGATYAWDMPRYGAPGGPVMLPDPTGTWERLRAEPDAERTHLGVDRILSFLLPVLRPDWPR